MLTQQRLPPPLTSTLNSSLFTHEHSSPLSLAARLHWCRTSCSHYSNNGWNFSGQTSMKAKHKHIHNSNFRITMEVLVPLHVTFSPLDCENPDQHSLLPFRLRTPIVITESTAYSKLRSVYHIVVRKNWVRASGQDRGVGRHTVPPRTTKRRTTI